MKVALAPTPPPTGLNFINRSSPLPASSLTQPSPILKADRSHGGRKLVLGGWRDSASQDQSEEETDRVLSSEDEGAQSSFGAGMLSRRGRNDDEIVFAGQRKLVNPQDHRSSNDAIQPSGTTTTVLNDNNSRRQSTTSSIASSSSTATTTHRQSLLSFNNSLPTTDTTMDSQHLFSGASPLRPEREIPIVAIIPSSDRSRGGSTTSSEDTSSQTDRKRLDPLREEEMDAVALQRWTKSASMGGIGKAIA